MKRSSVSKPSAPSAMKTSVTGFLFSRMKFKTASANSFGVESSGGFVRVGFRIILSYFLNSVGSFRIVKSLGTVSLYDWNLIAAPFAIESGGLESF